MTAAAAYPTLTDYRGSAQRIARALVLSAIAHLLLVQSLVFDAAHRAARSRHAGAMTVRIEHAAGTGTDSPAAVELATRQAAMRDGDGDIAPARSGAHVKRGAVVPLALPRTSDPTYYAARDLDLYPRPVVPLDLDRITRGVDEGGAARFRLLLLIDEGGAVKEIKFVEADPPGRLQEAVRAVLAATRFVPGEKAGHAVKSRVTLSVSLDSARVDSAGR